jgi:hypothetical protein
MGEWRGPGQRATGDHDVTAGKGAPDVLNVPPEPDRRATDSDPDRRFVADVQERRAQLCWLLLRGRMAAKLTGAQAGLRAGMSQSKVSKIENGRMLPRLADVKRLVSVCALGTEERERIISLAHEVVRDVEHRRAETRQRP